MLQTANSQYLFMLPLPLSAPGLRARLGGMALNRTDTALNQTGENSLLRIKRPPYALPNPIYLFKQGILPQLFDNGLSEYEFLTELESLTAPEHVLPVCFGFKYLAYTDALSLRCFKQPSLFKNRDLLDLKVVLQAARLFGSLSHLKAADCASLNAAEKALNMHTNGSKLADRAVGLALLLTSLKRSDFAILNFCLKGRAERERRLNQSLTEGRTLICCDGSSFSLLRTMEFSADGSKVKVLRCAPDLSLEITELNLSDPQLIAPASILTPERQQRLNLDLSKVETLLNQAYLSGKDALGEELPVHLEPKLFDKFRAKLTDKEFELFLKIGTLNPQLLPRLPLWTSPFFKELFFLYQADNFRESLISAELERYAQYCRVHLSRQLEQYMVESKTATSLLPEDDEKASRLLYDIVNYPSTL